MRKYLKITQEDFASQIWSCKNFANGWWCFENLAFGFGDAKISHLALDDVKFSHLELLVRNFRTWNWMMRNFCIWLWLMRNSFSTWCGCLQMAITSSVQLWFAHRLKCWTLDFPRFEKIYSMYTMDSRKCSKFFLQLLSFWISYSMRNCFMLDFSLWFSSLHLLIVLETYLQGLHKFLLYYWLALMIKKLPKTPKLAKNWLETFIRVLNMPIELKGIN